VPETNPTKVGVKILACIVVGLLALPGIIKVVAEMLWHFFPPHFDFARIVRIFAGP
jgi:hypothetical protein